MPPSRLFFGSSVSTENGSLFARSGLTFVERVHPVATVRHPSLERIFLRLFLCSCQILLGLFQLRLCRVQFLLFLRHLNAEIRLCQCRLCLDSRR